MKGKAGGMATAKKFRTLAVENYYKEPRICMFCNNIIVVKATQKVAEVKKKKFCTRKCSASYYGILRKKVKPVRVMCSLDNKTKSEIFSGSKNYFSARSIITKHARYKYKKQNKNAMECIVCGYSLHVETAHIKPVMSFPDSALISEINSLNNLIGLCPNHHWEFDNNLLTISKTSREE